VGSGCAGLFSCGNGGGARCGSASYAKERRSMQCTCRLPCASTPELHCPPAPYPFFPPLPPTPPLAPPLPPPHAPPSSPPLAAKSAHDEQSCTWRTNVSGVWCQNRLDIAIPDAAVGAPRSIDACARAIAADARCEPHLMQADRPAARARHERAWCKCLPRGEACRSKPGASELLRYGCS
jgi:hypothetical protein